MTLSQIVKIDNRFEKSVNLLLDLNSKAKIEGYIPTRSSVNILLSYLKEVISFSGNRATILVGPYGKGKSHLLLVLLALLSKSNSPELDNLISRIIAVDEGSREVFNKITADDRPMLPVIVNATNVSLDHAMVRALNIALTSAGIHDMVSDDLFTEALKAIQNWKDNFPNTYNSFIDAAKKYTDDIVSGLEKYDYSSFQAFQELYPSLTSGATFNPDIDSEVISIYRSVNRKLREKYGYKGIYIVFDEFSKYIEGHEENGFSSDMKILQDICDLANASHEEQLHITCVAHKSIRAYGSAIPKSVLNAFEGVEGRLKEVFFTVSSKNNYELIADAITKKDSFDGWAAESSQYKEITDSSLGLSNFWALFTEADFRSIVAKGCFPLTPVAAMLLLALSEKIAQNERTIFTFITSKERTGLERIVSRAKDDRYVGVEKIYDYFQPLFSEGIETDIYHEWLKADYAISKTENVTAQAIIKALATVNMVNMGEELPANENLLRLSLGIQEEEFNEALKSLVDGDLIVKRRRNGAEVYEFKNNFGADLEKQISDCIKTRFKKPDYCSELDHINRTKYVAPKKHNQTFSMTRYFNLKFLTAQQFVKLNDRHYLKFDHTPDGVIILLLPGEFSQEALLQHLHNIQDPCVVMLMPRDGFMFEDHVKRLLAVIYLRSDPKFIDDNKVVFRELVNMEYDLVDEINEMIRECYFRSHTVYTADGAVTVDANGLNRIISNICDRTYTRTPVINHELINRSNLSAPIQKAESTIINRMLKGENLALEYGEGTSADATVCRATLLVNDDNSGKKDIYDVISTFIIGSTNNKQNFSVLINTLTSAPFGMRKGPIGLFIADQLLKLRGMPIISTSSKELPLNSETISNIVRKPEDYFLYVEKESVQKEKYVSDLEDLFRAFEIYCNTTDYRNKLGKVACLMQSWYRSLPQTSTTFTEPDSSNDNITEISRFRSLLSGLHLNPHDVIFVKIPEIMGTNDYSEIIRKISLIKESVEKHLDFLKEKVITAIREEFGFQAGSNLAKSLNDWYADLSDIGKNSILSTKASAVRKYCSEVSTNDEYEISSRLGKTITGTYIEDWKTGMENNEFRTELHSVISEIIEKSASPMQAIPISEGTSEKKYYMPVTNNLSTSGHFFKNALDDLLDEYGTKVTNEEKVSILMDIIKNMVN